MPESLDPAALAITRRHWSTTGRRHRNNPDDSCDDCAREIEAYAAKRVAIERKADEYVHTLPSQREGG